MSTVFGALVVETLAGGTVLLNVALVVGATAALVDRVVGLATVRRACGALRRHALSLAFAQAAVATAGSLFLSLGLGWTPCWLCWLQRIAMYPLVVVLGVAVLRRDRAGRRYAAPLAALGVPVATAHYLLQRTTLVGSGTCSLTGPSCATTDLLAHGYVTVPAMALTAFVTVLLLLWLAPPTGSPDR